MSQIKLPQVGCTLNKNFGDNPTPEDQWTQINPSCLLAYLGIKGYGTLAGVATKEVKKNATPMIMYYDIFKNYYANTQEDDFYIIGNTENLEISINGTSVNPNVIPSNLGRVNNSGSIEIRPNTIKENEYKLK